MLELTEQTFWSLLRNWRWPIVGAAVLVVLSLTVPGFTFFWDVRGYAALFHDHLGLGAAWAEVAALPFAFINAIAFPIALRWLVLGRKPAPAFLALLFVYGTTPLLHAMMDTNFDQRGPAQKWYAVQPGGEIILSDTGGVDPTTGAERRRLTDQVARIIVLQKKGIRPRIIAADPEAITFFDPITGQPEVWYARGYDGSYRLFGAEGFDETTGAILTAVTPAIVEDIRKRAAAESARAVATSRAAAERADAEEREKRHRALIMAFIPESYPQGTTIVGAKPRELHDHESAIAAQQIITLLTNAIRAKGTPASKLADAAYDPLYYDPVMSGEHSVLFEAGVEQHIRASIFALVDTRCQPSSSIPGLFSCTVTADFRLFRQNDGVIISSSDALIETGAGSTREEAIARAAQYLVERHSTTLVDR
nr:hypothetical protein [uncultured Rhodopila sp.]